MLSDQNKLSILQDFFMLPFVFFNFLSEIYFSVIDDFLKLDLKKKLKQGNAFFILHNDQACLFTSELWIHVFVLQKVALLITDFSVSFATPSRSK